MNGSGINFIGEIIKLCSQTTSLKEFHRRYGARLRNWREFLVQSVALSPSMGFLLIRISLGNFRVIFFNAFISLFLNFIFSSVFIFVVDLYGMKQSIQLCHPLERQWMEFILRLPRLKMILRYLLLYLQLFVYRMYSRTQTTN